MALKIVQKKTPSGYENVESYLKIASINVNNISKQIDIFFHIFGSREAAIQSPENPAYQQKFSFGFDQLNASSFLAAAYTRMKVNDLIEKRKNELGEEYILSHILFSESQDIINDGVSPKRIIHPHDLPGGDVDPEHPDPLFETGVIQEFVQPVDNPLQTD